MTAERAQRPDRHTAASTDQQIAAPTQSSRARVHAMRALNVVVVVAVVAAVSLFLFYGLLFVFLAGSGF